MIKKSVLGVFNKILFHFCDNWGHELGELRLKLDFWVFIQIVVNQEKKKH